jgi:hypothetical protein
MYMYTPINTNTPNSDRRDKNGVGEIRIPFKKREVGGLLKKNHLVARSQPHLLAASVLPYSFSGISAGANWIRFPHRSCVLPNKHPRKYPMYAPVIIVTGYACHGRSLDVMVT